MKKTFLSSIHERRSVYSITNTSPIPKNFYEPAQTILQHGRSDN